MDGTTFDWVFPFLALNRNNILTENFVIIYATLVKQSSNGAFCFKLCTLPNRIKLNNEDDEILSEKDDFSVVKLDKDLIDILGLKTFLLRILCSLRKDLDIQISDIESIFVNEESILHLVIASGGTPRDFFINV